MHFHDVLTHNDTLVVFQLQLIESEESQVCEDGIQVGVLPVGSHRRGASFDEEHFQECFEEWFVPHTAIEDLLQEHLLIGILHLEVRTELTLSKNSSA